MKNYFGIHKIGWLSVLLLAIIALTANATDFQGKAIYCPKDLIDNDFSNPESKWSFSRMAETENIVLFWAPDFGDNISQAPDLDGHNMCVDLANLLARLEQFYHYFYHDLGFVSPGSKADKYRMMVMLDYSLEGTAYGGSYDDVIGALWIAPNRVQDKALNCIAHELGHSFQSQITCDGQGDAWGGCGLFEMAAQWMLWQVNPDWQTDENYHLKAFQDQTHKAFLHLDNIYHSPYVLEYWSERRGLPFIAQLFREGRIGEDPVQTYQRITGVDQRQFCDEMFDAARCMVNWDYSRIWDHSRQYAGKGWHTPMIETTGRWKMPSKEACPENYGFNVVPIDLPVQGKTLSIDFKGMPGEKGYASVNTKAAGWRYGLVVIDKEGRSTYTPMQSKRRGQIRYKIRDNDAQIFLVVMGAPTWHWPNIDGPSGTPDAQWPYAIKISEL